MSAYCARRLPRYDIWQVAAPVCPMSKWRLISSARWRSVAVPSFSDDQYVPVESVTVGQFLGSRFATLPAARAVQGLHVPFEAMEIASPESASTHDRVSACEPELPSVQVPEKATVPVYWPVKSTPPQAIRATAARESQALKSSSKSGEMMIRGGSIPRNGAPVQVGRP